MAAAGGTITTSLLCAAATTVAARFSCEPESRARRGVDTLKYSLLFLENSRRGAVIDLPKILLFSSIEQYLLASGGLKIACVNENYRSQISNFAPRCARIWHIG